MLANFVKLHEHWRFDPYSDPPLGMLYVIAVARQSKIDGEPIEVIFTDMAHQKEIPPADVFALSVCTLDYPEAIRVAEQIKRKYNKPVVVGGPHFDAIEADVWEKEIASLPFDIICKGEGEVTFLKALRLLKEYPTCKAVVKQNPPLVNMDTLPAPAFDILEKERYFKPGKAFAGNIFSSGNSATMMTSRGCPFVCSFCASPILHNKRVRYRNISSVKMELDLLMKQYDVTEIRFQDDCFTINERRFVELCNLLKEAKVCYRCSMRVDQVDNLTLQRLWDSGCREIGFGIESAEDEVLKLLKKKTTAALNLSALKKTKEYGFRTRAFMMTGLPGEKKGSAQKMIDLLEAANPDVITLTSFMPLPGSDVYNNPEAYGVTILDKDWKNYDISLKWQSQVPFVHTISTATREEMEVNRELLKEYLFNRRKSNISGYNKTYVSPVLHAAAVPVG